MGCCFLSLLAPLAASASSLFDEFHVGVGDRLNWDNPVGSGDYTSMRRITDALEGLGVNDGTSGLTAKYIAIWMVPGWQESWFPAADVQRYLIDKGYVPVFIHWWFGDDTEPCTILENESAYYADLDRAAAYLDQLSGEALFVLEPEFNTTEAIKDTYPGSTEPYAVSSCPSNPTLDARFNTFSVGEVLRNGMQRMEAALSGASPAVLYGTAPGTWDSADQLHNAMSAFATQADFVGVQSIHASTYHSADDAYDSADLALGRLIEYHQIYDKPTFVPYFAVSTYEDDNDGATSQNQDGKRWYELQLQVVERYRKNRYEMIEDAASFGLVYMSAFDDPNHHGFFGAAEYYLGLADDEGTTTLSEKPAFDAFFSTPAQHRHSFTVSDGVDAGEVVYYGNRSIDGDGALTGVTRAVIAVHGVGRSPWTAYNATIDAALSEDRTGDTLVIAPYFQKLEDNPAAGELYWGSSWNSGYDSEPQSGLPTLSSYAVMDQLVDALFDTGRFPDLSDIVIVGHSAGGQFVHRYAAGTEVDFRRPGYHFRYVVANPGTYMYLDNTRPVGDDPQNPFYQVSTTFVDPVTSGNGVPPEAEDGACLTPDAQSEYEYDEYKHGLVDRFVAPYMDAKAAQTLREDYAGREVVYLLGTDDTNRDHQHLARDCAADLQGYHRFQRGLNYYNHLNDLVDRTVLSEHHHALVKVLNAGHWSREMYGSNAGRKALFGTLTDADDNGVNDSLEDADGDGFLDTADNCPNTANDDQWDSDRDGIGNFCDVTPYGGDSDGDGIEDTFDNCPHTYNPDQSDTLNDGSGHGAGDGIGDACAVVDDLFYYRTVIDSWGNGYCIEFTATYVGSESTYDIPWGLDFYTAGAISEDPSDTWNADFDDSSLPLIRITGYWNVKETRPTRDGGLCIVGATEPTRPVITRLGDAEITLGLGETFRDPGATAIDYFVDGIDGPDSHYADLTQEIVVGGDTVNTQQPGRYTITYNVSDSRGNEAREVTRSVTVADCGSGPLTVGPATYSGNTTLRSASTLSTSGRVVIENGGAVLFEAVERITLNPGFQAAQGSSFVARLAAVDCGG